METASDPAIVEWLARNRGRDNQSRPNPKGTMSCVAETGEEDGRPGCPYFTARRASRVKGRRKSDLVDVGGGSN